MALAGKASNVIPEGLTLLILATLQILGDARLYVRALEVVAEDLPKILPAINRVPGQVVELGPGHVGQVNAKKLDDEEVIVGPAHLACKVVILQPHAGVGFAVIPDNVVWHPKTLQETRVAHVAPKSFGP
jgi:hypothetical protein